MSMSLPAVIQVPQALQGARNNAILGIGQIMLAAALWSTVGVATELVPAAKAVPQEVLGTARMLIGGVAILLVLVFGLRGSLRPALSLDPRGLVDFAAGAAVFQLCLFKSFELLGVTATVFFTVCLPPVISQLWDMLRHRRAHGAETLQALSMAVMGLVVFAGWEPGTIMDWQTMQGLAVAVLGSVAFVIMTAAARSLSQVVSPMLVAGVGLCLAGVLLAVVGVLLAGEDIAAPPAMDWQVVGLLVYLGLGPTALAYVLYCTGMARCRTANVGLVASMVEPALAALLAWLLIGELLSAQELAGCLLLMLAMVALWHGEQRRATVAAKNLAGVPQGTDDSESACDGLFIRGGQIRPFEGETEMSTTHSCIAQIFTAQFEPTTHQDEESSIERGRRAQLEAWSLKRLATRLVRRMRGEPDGQAALDAAIMRLADLSPHLLVDVGVDPLTGLVAEEGVVLTTARPMRAQEPAPEIQTAPMAAPRRAVPRRLQIHVPAEMPRPMGA